MNDRFKFRVPVFYDGKFKAFKKYSLCNGVVIWEEPETIGELWIEDELKRNNPHLSLGHDEQCSGFKDKNGKLIYEGDIIEKQNQKFVIKYEFDSFVAYSEEKKPVSIYGLFTFKLCFGGWPEKETENTIEVIGNIHETPELWEVQDEV